MTFDEICRRAGGRRRYNAQRQDAAVRRRRQVLTLLMRGDLTQRAMADRLGVHESQISRDVKWLGSMPMELRYVPYMGVQRVKWRIDRHGWEIWAW